MTRTRAWRHSPCRVAKKDAFHVWPVRDMQRHALFGLVCWCDPKVTYFPNGNMLVVHNSKDGRELIEQHGVN